MNIAPQTFAALIAALLLSPALASAGENDNCLECGLRKPGNRPRELAILTAVTSRVPSSSPYDFDAAKSRGTAFTRPTSAEVDQMSSRDPLMKAMNADPVSFSRMRYLMPENFRIVDGSQFQSMIEDTLLKMASTKEGKKAVCPFSGQDSKAIMTYFAVREPAAKTINDGCKGYPVSPTVRNYVQAMSFNVPPKKIVILFTDGPRPSIEAYSSKNNTTYLVLTKDTFNPDSMNRMLSHEMAMSYDQLSRFGYHANVSSLEDQGTPLGWGKSPFDNVFENPRSTAELEKAKCSFRDPAIRYAAAAQRAFKFEDGVASELGGSPAVAATGTCSQVLAKNSVLLQAMARTVSWDTGWYEAGCGIAKDPAARLTQVLSRIHDVESYNLTCKNPADCGGRKQIPLCEVLLNPRIGPFYPDLDSGGPRPRMGGGWDGAMIDREDLIVRVNGGETPTPEQASELGKSLLFPNIDELHREEDGERPPAGRKPKIRGVSI